MIGFLIRLFRRKRKAETPKPAAPTSAGFSSFRPWPYSASPPMPPAPPPPPSRSSLDRGMDMLSGGMIGYALGSSRVPHDPTIHMPQSTPSPVYEPSPAYEPSRNDYCPSPSYDSGWSSSPTCDTGSYE